MVRTRGSLRPKNTPIRGGHSGRGFGRGNPQSSSSIFIENPSSGEEYNPSSSTQIRKRKRSETREGSSHSENPVLAASYLSPEQEWIFNTQFRNRGVSQGRIFEANFCLRENLSFYSKFQALGWDAFIGIEESYYPTLIQVFYTNLNLKNGFLHSNIKGVDIRFDYKILNTIIGIENKGLTVYANRSEINIDWYSEMMAVMHLTQNFFRIKAFPLTSSDFTVEARLIHNALFYCVIPRGSGRTHVSHLDLFLIWCITMGIELNLGYIIFQHLLQFIANPDDTSSTPGKIAKLASLPYGMFLTRIFKYFNVPLDSEFNKKDPTHEDKLSLKILKNMQCHKVNGVWERLPAAPVPAAPAPAVDPLPEGDPFQHQGLDFDFDAFFAEGPTVPQPPSPPPIPPEMTQLLHAQHTEIMAAIRALGDRVTALETRADHVGTSLIARSYDQSSDLNIVIQRAMETYDLIDRRLAVHNANAEIMKDFLKLVAERIQIIPPGFVFPERRRQSDVPPPPPPPPPKPRDPAVKIVD